MPNTVFNLQVTVNGRNVDLDEPPVFTTEDSDYGIKRIDNNNILVVAQTPMTRRTTGKYEFSFAEPADGLQYDYALKTTFEGETFYYNKTTTGGTLNLNLTIPSTAYYSSEAEVMRLLGKFAVDLIMEDRLERYSVWEDILSYVDETIYQYVSQQYDPSNLKRNKYIRRRATILASHYLSQRRGNPPLYLREATTIRDELEAIRNNNFHIPNSIPLGNLGPVVRNYVMQPSRLIPQRVQAFKSTGDSYPQEKISFEPYMFLY